MDISFLNYFLVGSICDLCKEWALAQKFNHKIKHNIGHFIDLEELLDYLGVICKRPKKELFRFFVNKEKIYGF